MLTIEEKREILEELKKELYSAKKVYVEVCREGVILPSYADIGDAGMDIRAVEDVTIEPGETKVIKTGLKMAIPDGYEIQVRPRSGLSLKTNLRVSNSPGTVDSGYKDEIGVILTNISNENNGVYTLNDSFKQGTYEIKKGDRIAQIVLCKYEIIEFEQVSEGKVKEIGTNRGGGFGHTGI